MNEEFNAGPCLSMRNTHASNTPNEEDIGVPDKIKGSRSFFEHVTWFVSSRYVAFGRRTGNAF